jgi:hypothetical protein
VRSGERLASLLLIVLSAMPMASYAQMESGDDPLLRQVDMALEQVRKDPQLKEKETVRVPAWVKSADDEERETEDGPVLRALRAMLDFLTGAGRWLFLALVLILFAVLVLVVIQQLRGRSRWGASVADALPTHVRDLDVRPESLPAEIGRAAWALWERGEGRQALGLLYRGLLSRMVYSHGIPIRDSSTEGDCRALSATYLPDSQRRLAGELIEQWQRTTYGGRPPDADAVRGLCDAFDRELPAHG